MAEMVNCENPRCSNTFPKKGKGKYAKRYCSTACRWAVFAMRQRGPANCIDCKHLEECLGCERYEPLK